MCRCGNEPLAGGGTEEARRCPSSGGEQRRASDRLRYRSSVISRNLSEESVETTLSLVPQAAAKPAPTVEDLRDQQQRVEDAWQSFKTAESPSQERADAKARYEEQVRVAGQMVHDRAVAEFGLKEGLTDQEEKAWAERLDPIQKKYDDAGARQSRYAEGSREQGGIQNVSEEYKAQWQAVSDEVRGLGRELAEIKREMYEEQQSRSLARRDAYQQVIGEVQELGGEVEMVTTSKAASYRAARDAVQREAQNIPSVWIEQSNDSHKIMRPLYVTAAKGRAHYVHYDDKAPIGPVQENLSGGYIHDDPDNPPDWVGVEAKGKTWFRDDEWDAGRYGPNGSRQGEYVWRLKGKGKREKQTAARLTVSGHDDITRSHVARHEFSHRIEAMSPRVSNACTEFLRRRSTNEDGTRQSLSPIYGDRSEVGWRDGFADHYIGKHYGDHQPHTEVFSVGSEAIWNGSEGGLAGDSPNSTADPEHRNLILGLYASARKD